MQSVASPNRHPFSHSDLCLVSFPPVSSPPHPSSELRAQWSNSLAPQLIILRPSEERRLAQGHTTSQTRTLVPTFPGPGTLTHQGAFLFSKEQDRKEVALSCGGLNSSRGLIHWGVCLELRSYGVTLRSSCHLLTKTCLI